MSVIARYPRVGAWLVAMALIGTGTAAGLLGLRVLQPAMPTGMEHVHGVVVAVEANGIFALQVAGHAGWLWFRPAPGAPISLAHLRRHLRERAATDVWYAEAPMGATGVATARVRALRAAVTSGHPQRVLFLAWRAD